jgi:DNA ligase (NAD+)
MKDSRAILKSLQAAINFTEAVSYLTLEETRLLVDKADSLYYREGLSEIMTNAEYDVVKEHLKRLDPNDERLTRVGVPYSPEELDNKVTHAVPMGSLDNTDEGILGYEPWLEWITDKLGGTIPNIYATLKVDGGSICATYKAGKLVRVATRGNAEVGEDITANAVNFQGLPTVLPQAVDAEIRGEAVLYIKDYKVVRERELGTPFDQIPEADRSNPRNIGNGILGRHDGTDSDKIRFLAFNLWLGASSLVYGTEEQKFQALRELGFTPVPGELCKNVQEFMAFYNKVVNGRNALPFEVDGIVVVVNNLEYQDQFITSDPKSRLRPKYARAVKFPHKSNVTTLEGLEITVGHTRSIIPTAKLKTVRIGGVNVDSALLNNFAEIQRLDIAIGDEVEVVLAGDIIPKVIRKVKDGANRTPIVEPTTCPACGSATSRLCRGKVGAVTYCCNARCPAAVFAKLNCWIGTSKKGVGILDIGDTMIKALWEKGLLTDPADLYTLTVEAIQDVKLASGGRIGKSRATKIVSNIQAKKILPLHTFLGSLGIDLLGRRRVLILKQAANGQLDTLDDWLDDNKLASIQIPGLGDSIRHAIRTGVDENRALIAKLRANGVVAQDLSKVTVTVVPADGTDPELIIESENIVADPTKKLPAILPFTGLSFCFTGTREGLEDVEKLGGTIKSGISKGLDYLVQKDPLSQSKKTQKAEEYGTQIIGIDYLQRAINGEVTLTKASNLGGSGIPDAALPTVTA